MDFKYACGFMAGVAITGLAMSHEPAWIAVVILALIMNCISWIPSSEWN